MDREGFRNRLKQYKLAREENPGLKYWEWKDIPKYDEGTNKVVPTEKEYITQQIAAEKATALKKSYDRQYPKVPTSGGKRSKADWENSLNKLEEYLNTLLSRWGITPSQKTIWLNNLKALQSQREAGYDAYIGEGKILGPSCAYTTGDNYGIDCISSELFRQNHADYGFREIPYNQVQPSDVVLDYNPAEQRATHTMMYSKKGSDGVARFNHSNGGHTAEAIRKDARYPFKGQPLAYEFVGTPADSAQWINDYKKIYGYADGGEVDPRQNVLRRANKVATNYSDAKDFTLDPFNYAVRKIAKTLTGRGGISNCTLSATGWVDPNNQYMSARNLFNNPESGYIEIDKAYALPGDLLVAKNPEKDSYHTMLIEEFNGDDPLLRYSRGGHDTKKNLVTGRSLEEYHRLDNEQGGNHTEDHYFRYNLPNEYWLPEITVTPKKYNEGTDSVNNLEKLSYDINETKQWLRNWYAGRLLYGKQHSNLDIINQISAIDEHLYPQTHAYRMNLPWDNSIVTTLRKPTIDRTTVKIDDAAINDFSNKTKNTIGGYYHPVEGIVLPTTYEPSTVLHETVHTFNGAGKTWDATYDALRDESGNIEHPAGLPSPEYWVSPEEVHSRLMEFRKINNLNPLKKYTLDDIKELRKTAKDRMLLFFNDEQLLNLLNNVATVNKKEEHKYKSQRV